MGGNGDDTVILRPPRRSSPARLALAAAALVVVLGLGAVWLAWPTHPLPEPTIAALTEAELAGESPVTRTVRRFASNPAILVIDFPTLAEQGRMLNRVAAWSEKAGVPHDRLLDDAELETAIQAGGATADTYYFGHDYRGADIARFFVLADREHRKLRPEEQQLRLLVAQARAEPPGLGALITLPRANAQNQVDAAARVTILHHELSHGEYFTNPIYADFVRLFWTNVLTASERTMFRAYLTKDGYDPALEDLMINEMQAYLMHTPDARFFDPAQLSIQPARLAEIRQIFLTGMPAGWLRDVTGPAPRPSVRRAPRMRRARGRRRQWPGRVSRTIDAAATLPPRRRRLSIAV